MLRFTRCLHLQVPFTLFAPSALFAQEGKYYPPQCLPLDSETGLSPNCAEVLMVNPAYCQGWFESTVENLPWLNFSFSYLRENAAVPYVLEKLRKKEPVRYFGECVQGREILR